MRQHFDALIEMFISSHNFTKEEMCVHVGVPYPLLEKALQGDTKSGELIFRKMCRADKISLTSSNKFPLYPIVKCEGVFYQFDKITLNASDVKLLKSYHNLTRSNQFIIDEILKYMQKSI